VTVTCIAYNLPRGRDQVRRPAELEGVVGPPGRGLTGSGQELAAIVSEMEGGAQPTSRSERYLQVTRYGYLHKGF
jgi:hypothetical protein